jgi:hypothetical protein
MTFCLQHRLKQQQQRFQSLKKPIGKLKKQLCVHKAKDKKASSVSSSHTMDGRDLMELDGAILQEVNYLNSIETGGKRLLLR